MRFDIRFSGDSNLKDSKFSFAQPYMLRCNIAGIMKDLMLKIALENSINL